MLRPLAYDGVQAETTGLWWVHSVVVMLRPLAYGGVEAGRSGGTLGPGAPVTRCGARRPLSTITPTTAPPPGPPSLITDAETNHVSQNLLRYKGSLP